MALRAHTEPMHPIASIQAAEMTRRAVRGSGPASDQATKVTTATKTTAGTK